MKFATLSLLLPLGACSLVGLDPATHCPEAQAALTTAQQVAATASAIAAVNPQSPKMQAAAAQAQDAVAKAQAVLAVLCPPAVAIIPAVVAP